LLQHHRGASGLLWPLQNAVKSRSDVSLARLKRKTIEGPGSSSPIHTGSLKESVCRPLPVQGRGKDGTEPGGRVLLVRVRYRGRVIDRYRYPVASAGPPASWTSVM
jgi:hypothetical protein